MKLSAEKVVNNYTTRIIQSGFIFRVITMLEIKAKHDVYGHRLVLKSGSFLKGVKSDGDINVY